MATSARDRGPWLVLAVLAVLLGTLAYLQFRWTREIGRAAAERRQAELQRAARRFAFALDRELGQAAIAFFPDLGPPPLDRRAFLLDRLDAWQTRENAGLVSGLLLATRPRAGRPTLEETHRGEDAFHEVEWTDEVRDVAQLAAPGDGHGFGPTLRPGAVLRSPLALVLPLYGAPVPNGEHPGRRRLNIEGVVLVKLDEDYLRNRLLPRLAEAHFGAVAASPFVFAVLRRVDQTVFYESVPGAITGGHQGGDVELDLPGRGRGPGLAPQDPPGPEAGGKPADPSPWRLVARHRSGAFEAAVTSVERRNLATGLGVLALLGATALVLVASAQRARRLARQQLEFVTGVTHELNTPLAAIRSAGQNLSAGIVTQPAQVRRYGELIEKEGGRLTALVAQVLDFAGIESGTRAFAHEPFSLAAVVDDVLRDHRLVLEQAGITLERQIPEGLPELRGDAAALRKAIANLLANAAKFAAAGRWIGLRASARPDGRALELRVEDKGPGIPREERERVFEPFHRGRAAESNATPGSGLGLSLVRHVVRAHGGRVHVEPREGGGAAFVVELPTAAAQGLP
jgi:signal transduction histidine kinase